MNKPDNNLYEPTEDEKRWFQEAKLFIGANPKEKGVQSLVKFRDNPGQEIEEYFQQLVESETVPPCVFAVPSDEYDPTNNTDDRPERTGLRVFFKN